MRTIADYRSEILSKSRVLGSESTGLGTAVGRILATDIVAPHDVPSFANSAMDGFAVVASDVITPGAQLEIVEDIAAGSVGSKHVEPGQAARIMTGAPMPRGADTVVRVENTSETNGKVEIHTALSLGNSVRPVGGDVTSGTVVFAAGTRLTPTHIGTLATIGVVEIVVGKRPKVAVMSTGDELVPAETVTLDPGKIRDSNRPMIVALAEASGAEVIDCGRIPDNAVEFRAAIGQAVAEADVIVTSGGVSMGDFDVVKAVLRDEAGVDFFPVAMKPGKPQGFGVLGGTLFFGLPGNPVSVFVSFEQFVRPALLAMQGATRLLRQRVKGVAGEVLTSDVAKEEFVRVRYNGDVVVISGGSGSHVLSGAANADAFAVLGIGEDRVDKGAQVVLELFGATETRMVTDG